MIWDKLFKRKRGSEPDDATEQDVAESPPTAEDAEEDAMRALLAGMGDLPEADAAPPPVASPPPAESSYEPEEDDIPEDLLEDFNKRFQQLENDINLQRRMAEKQVVADDIDSQIEQLLEKDANEVITSEGKTDFVNEVSVFNTEKGIVSESELNARDPDTVRRRRQAGEGEPSLSIMERIKMLSVKTLFIITGVLVALIVCFGAATFVLADRVHKAEQEAKKITHPLTAGNNSNYIYISEQVFIDGEPLVLEKILIDNICTQFYFTQYFDAFHYDITLFDDQENEYQMDLNHLMDVLSEDEKGQTILRFEAFEPQINEFTLRIHDPLTDKDMDFRIELNKSLVLPSARFINEPIEAYVDDDLTIMIEPSYFSRAGSVIRYSVKWLDDNRGIQFAETFRNEDRNITLTEESRSVLRSDFVPALYTFADDDLILGRAEFDPLTNLDANIKLTIQNLFRTFRVNASIPTDKLLQDEEGMEEIINIGPYRIVMERIVRQGDLVILVLHTEEKVPESEDLCEAQSPISTQRVQTEMDAELHVTLGSGIQAILKGVNYSGDVGTDVLFDLRAYEGFNIGTPKEMTIEIKSVSIKMSDITVPIDLSTHNFNQQGEASEAVHAISDAFDKRLQYKSGKVNKGDLTGFAPSVLSDESLMAEYAPEAGNGQAKYSVQVMIDYLSEYKMIAVVRETWAAPGQYYADVFHKVHRVEAEKNQTGWMITRDIPAYADPEPDPVSDTYFLPEN